MDQPNNTDSDYISIGCTVLFLNWLHFQLGHGWAQIVAAGGATLAETYKGLTGQASAWNDFQAAMQQYFPVGTQYKLTTDNPFPLNDAVAVGLIELDSSYSPSALL